MREIKFRAWHNYDMKMYEVQSLDFFWGLIDLQWWTENEDGGETHHTKQEQFAGEVDGEESDERKAYNSVFGIELMQYTGCKDKNGKEIYEGDIIEFVWKTDSCWGDEGTYRGYVQHDDGGYEVVYINRQEYTPTKDGGKHPNSKSDELQSFIRWTEGVNIEVIGNIYQKPELLKV